MAKILIKIPEPKEEYDFSNQKTNFKGVKWDCRTIELNVFTATKRGPGTIYLVYVLMANVYKVVPILIDVTTANQDVYEVPAATTSIIRSISVYNTDGSAMNVTLSLYDTSATTRYTYDYKSALAAATKFEFFKLE